MKRYFWVRSKRGEGTVNEIVVRLPEWAPAMHRVVWTLAPGGWAMVGEDFYYGSSMCLIVPLVEL